MNLIQPIQHLINTNGRHPITIGDPALPNPLTLAYHPDQATITADRQNEYPTQYDADQIAQAIIRVTGVKSLTLSTRLGLSDHTPTIFTNKKGKKRQYYKPTVRIIEFHWTKKETPS